MQSIKKNRDDLLFQILVNLFLISLLAVMVLPLWRVFVMSITPLNYIDTQTYGMWLNPSMWSFEAYKQLLSHPSFLRATTNSFIITFGGTTINMLLTVPLAYALSNRRLPGRKFFITLILIPFLFNAGMIPTYLVVQKFDLVDTFWAVILPGGINITNLLIMKNFFEGLPDELEEAAYLDGANEIQVLFRVVLPLAKPILLTIGLFYMVGHWNEFFSAILYLNDAKLQPLPVLLRNILLAANINEYVEYDAFSNASIQAIKAASVFLTMLPMVIIYPWIQHYFTKGTLLGGVKE
ncbi:MAG: carbohydrate ABC transporter permease [Chloroflexi bacterium]|jgi:putative aldouronate transport system permease protein|nr:carbohydrate ABC transporter permease [Anaerolineaceae bacterium]NMB90839.1 carbohydrate ABC transporter permease [Chloroflexota bacterium]